MDKAFEQLVEALETAFLPTKDGKHRKADADEFMLMTPSPINGQWQFKHAPTRNYLLVSETSGKITIPTGGAFFMGYFDKDGEL